MKSSQPPEVTPAAVAVPASIGGSVDPLWRGRPFADLSVIVSKRNENWGVILLMPKEREWNL